MSMNRKIPDQFQDQILAMPEYKYGATRIRVFLDDDRIFTDVYVAWGTEIIKVGASEKLPFDPLQIIRVEKQ